MKKTVLCLLTSLMVVSVVLSHQELRAAPYYEGKNLTIIVGYSPGGGYDRLSRVIAKHLPRYIPGKPTVLVQNMPGAGSIIAANHVFNLGPANDSGTQYPWWNTCQG